MFGKLGEKLEKIGEHLGIVTPVPTLLSHDIPSSSVFSSKGDQNLHKIIAKKQKMIEIQEGMIHRMNDENIKFSRIIGAISLSVGIILGGIGMSVVSQSNPDGFIQKFSSKIAKVLGSEKTAYDFIEQERTKDSLIAGLQDTLQTYKKLAGTQDELLKAKNTQMELLGEKFESLHTDINDLKDTLQTFQSRSGKIVALPESKTDQNTLPKPATDENISGELPKKVQGYIAEVNKKMPSGVTIKMNQTSSKRVLVWLEKDGKKSLGYYADSPKYKQRLSQEGVSTWANQTLSQLQQIETIEQMVVSKGLPLGKKTVLHPMSVEIIPQYSGEIKVTVHDSSINKSITFVTHTNENSSQIHQKLDTTINTFFM